MANNNKFYLDTNILRDIVSNRDRNSVLFFELSKIADVELVSSIYAFMEFTDIKKDEIFFNNTVQGKGWDINKFLRERYRKEFKPYDIEKIREFMTDSFEIMSDIDILNLTNDGWELAIGISTNSCLTADDSLHLATVLSAQCNYLITNDRDFIKESEKIIQTTDQPNIKCLDSKQALEIMRQKIKDNLSSLK